MTTPKIAPGPTKQIPFIGEALRIRKDPLGHLTALSRKYGDVCQFRMGPFNVFIVNDTNGIKHVLQDNAANYVKSPLYQRMEQVLGNGLITSSGEHWKRQRKLTQPLFNRDKIASFSGIMASETRDLTARWENSQARQIDLNAEMMKLTCRIIARTMFGIDMESRYDELGDAWNAINAYFSDRFWAVSDILSKLPTPKNLRLKKNIAIFDRFIANLIQERKTSVTQDDLVGRLLAAKDETDESRMEDAHIRDEIMTFFLAGHETTAQTLTWALHLLSQPKHQNILERMEQEIDGVLAKGPLSFDRVGELSYTRLVLEESMRIYPPVWGIGRQAVNDDVVADYRIPKGSVVFLLQWVTHRDPKYWPEPENFLPERFLPEHAAGRPKFAYFPFGGGPRVCIGQHFAMAEALILLATMASRYRFRTANNAPVTPEALITLRPKSGLPVTLERRTASHGH